MDIENDRSYLPFPTVFLLRTCTNQERKASALGYPIAYHVLIGEKSVTVRFLLVASVHQDVQDVEQL